MTRLFAVQTLLFLFLAAASGCGSGDPAGVTKSFRLQGEALRPDPEGADFLVDFGRVELGRRAAPEIFIVNEGSEPLTVRIELADEGTPFSITKTDFVVPPRARHRLPISFSPSREGSYEALLPLRLPQLGQHRQIRLLGAGGQLLCAPTSVDIGPVVIGESRKEIVSCENPLDTDAILTIGSFLHMSPPHFSAVFADGTPGDTAVVPPGGTREIEIAFAAVDSVGPAEAILPLLGGNGQEIARIDIEAQAIAQAIKPFAEDADGELAALTGCLSFSPQGIGSEEEKILFLRNLGQQPVELTSLTLEPSEDFALRAPESAGQVLDPGEELEVLLAYAPSTSESHQGKLILQADGDRTVPAGGLEICLLGSSAGPTLVCEAESIDFGPVALATFVRRSLACENASVPGPNSPPLLFEADWILSDDDQFTPAIRNIGPPPGGPSYGPGETFLIDVEFAPKATGLHDGTVRMKGNAINAPVLALSVRGEGLNLPPCAFAIEPSNLDFGLVAPGDTQSLTAYIANTSQQDDCILSNIHLAENSDPAFSMAAVHSTTLPPGHRHPVGVSFTPDAEGTFEGKLRLFLSHPEEGLQEIALSGRGGESCLRLDREFEAFGFGDPQCASPSMLFSLGNFCAEEVVIDSIEIDPAYPDFTLAPLDPLPAALAEGDRYEFSVSFTPTATGSFAGAIRIEAHTVGGEIVAPLVAPLEGEAPGLATTWSDRFDAPPKLDLLLVMDNSGSVPVDQLQTRVDALLEAGFLQGYDFQVGVTTTAVSDTAGAACPPTGFAPENEDGRLVPHPSLARPRLLHSGMGKAPLLSALETNLEVGYCHFHEAVYEAARRAISAPWLHTPLDEGGNRGLLRHDAALAILGLTDEEDGDSKWRGDPLEDNSVSRYVRYFQNRKPSWKQEEVKVHMFSGGISGCFSALDSASPCPRCEEGPQRTGGLHLPVCQDPAGWDQAALAMGEAIFPLRTHFRLRSEPQDTNSDGDVDHKDLEVRVDGMVTLAHSDQGLRVWRYDESIRSIVFSPGFAPRGDQTVEVSYFVGCGGT